MSTGNMRRVAIGPALIEVRARQLTSVWVRHEHPALAGAGTHSRI